MRPKVELHLYCERLKCGEFIMELGLKKNVLFVDDATYLLKRYADCCSFKLVSTYVSKSENQFSVLLFNYPKQ